MAIKSFMKAMGNTMFGDGKSGIAPPPSMPTIHPVQFQQAQTGASWDNVHYGKPEADAQQV